MQRIVVSLFVSGRYFEYGKNDAQHRSSRIQRAGGMISRMRTDQSLRG